MYRDDLDALAERRARDDDEARLLARFVWAERQRRERAFERLFYIGVVVLVVAIAWAVPSADRQKPRERDVLEQLTDEVCACRDLQCALGVNTRVLEWMELQRDLLGPYPRDIGPDVQQEMERRDQLARRFNDCFASAAAE